MASDTKLNLPGAKLLPQPLRRHYASTLAGAALLLAALAGYWVYQGWQERHNELVSTIYWNLTEAIRDDKPESIADSYLALQEEGNEGQLVLAKFLLASVATEGDDPSTAETHLREIIAAAEQASFRDIARLRLARLLIVQDQLDEALALAEATESSSVYFDILRNDLLGDIQLLQGNHPDALSSFRAAIASARALEDIEYVGFIEGKLNMVHSAQLEQLLR